MEWFTFCGYDGSNNIIIYVQAIDQARAMEAVLDWAIKSECDPPQEFVFVGRHQDISAEEHQIVEIIHDK